MRAEYSLKEAAAIAEVSESAVRTAIEKKAVAPRARSAGKVVRYAFNAHELLYLKLLSAFPLDLPREDKRALRDLVSGHSSAGRWHSQGPDFVLQSDELVIHVEVKQLRDRLAHNMDVYDRGRRRVVSVPDVLGGDPVFEGTRIPLAHVAGLIAKGIALAEILEDHPSLSAEDVAFAAICARMKPNPGRPRKPLDIRRRGAPVG
jgi:uncharacterized protein (DUF433 family)